MKVIIDTKKVCNEIIEVLARNEVTIESLDRVLEYTRAMAHSNTIIQNDDQK